MAGILTLSLADIAPPNLTYDPSVSPVISATDPQLQTLSEDTITPALLARIDTLGAPALDLLAFQFHADFYDLASTADMKRAAVKDSLSWHMKKGTPYAVITALKALGVDAELIPWWKYGGRPYTFRIKADVTGNIHRTLPRDDITALITRAVNESKSARSFMEALDASQSVRETLSARHAVIPYIERDAYIIPALPVSPGASRLYWGGISFVEGDAAVPLSFNDTRTSELCAGCLADINIDRNIGVDLSIMQELLLQFEKRIFARIDDMELSLNSKIDANISQLDAKIDSVIDMLRWKGFDEDL